MEEHAKVELARAMIRTWDLRRDSGWREVSDDYGLSWLEAARQACADEDIAVLLNYIMAKPNERRGDRNILAWANGIIEEAIKLDKAASTAGDI